MRRLPFTRPDVFVTEFETYLRFTLDEQRRPRDEGFLRRFPTRDGQDEELAGRAFQGFINLCQTASFLARGRDE